MSRRKTRTGDVGNHFGTLDKNRFGGDVRDFPFTMTKGDVDYVEWRKCVYVPVSRLVIWDVPRSSNDVCVLLVATQI